MHGQLRVFSASFDDRMRVSSEGHFPGTEAPHGGVDNCTWTLENAREGVSWCRSTVGKCPMSKGNSLRGSDDNDNDTLNECSSKESQNNLALWTEGGEAKERVERGREGGRGGEERRWVMTP